MDSDIRLALMTGIDVPIPECKLVMHQPTIEEISYMGDSNFFTGVQTLCINKSMFAQDKLGLGSISNFQIFMMVMTQKETVDKKRKTEDVLSLVFPQYKATITPQSLLFIKKDETYLIDENNFEDLQGVMRKIFCVNEGPMDQSAFNPQEGLAQEIAKKLMRGRERVAAQKSNSNSSVFVQYLSILSLALNKTPKELSKLTMYQFYDLIERYSLKINWEADFKIRLAGGKPDSHPDYWMKNIH